MTTEEASRMELLARERVLEEQIQFLQEQLRTVRASLAASASGTVRMASPAPPVPPVNGTLDAAAVRAASAPLIPPAAASTAVAVAPASPSAPPVPESSLVKNTRKRGWLTARIEEIIAEGGPTFSYHTVFEAYKSKWGWRRWPTESSIGATVWKVVRKRGHPVLHPGSGRRSTVYQKEIRM